VSVYDVIVVGSGIVGLAHAWEAARRGLSVCVVERHARPIGASIRNFGFITVTGQGDGDTYRRARASRDVWAQIAPQADIPILQKGLWMVAHRTEAMDVLREFSATHMGQSCQLHDTASGATLAPEIRWAAATGGLYSPHELRIESREAIPKLIRWLTLRHGVAFRFGETVIDIASPFVYTTHAELEAERIVYCPGTALTGPLVGHLEPYRLALTRLQMLRVRSHQTFKLTSPVMMDLSLVRYAGYRNLPSAAALMARLQEEVPASLADGIHLIVVQSADGTLVVGDSHESAAAPEPFASEEIDDCILAHMSKTLHLDRRDFDVTERWIGEYPISSSCDALIEKPHASTRIVLVTSGTGASTAFGLAQDVFNDW
jgi:D-hydroxyproline dehydrogenase subunit beta